MPTKWHTLSGNIWIYEFLICMLECVCIKHIFIYFVNPASRIIIHDWEISWIFVLTLREATPSRRRWSSWHEKNKWMKHESSEYVIDPVPFRIQDSDGWLKTFQCEFAYVHRWWVVFLVLLHRVGWRRKLLPDNDDGVFVNASKRQS